MTASPPLRVVIAGLGVQGAKRRAFAGADVVATVDPVREAADYRRIEDVPLDAYDAVLACVPDGPKVALLDYLLGHGKHVLVEKPLWAESGAEIARLGRLAAATGAVCYTAYNHRFEPHFAAMRRVLESGELGRIYTVRLFYGNGTARLVRDSDWRDRGAGVLPDLGSHLLDTVLFWLGRPDAPFEVRSARRFENRAFDHVVLAADGRVSIELEMTLLSWRNRFSADILAERGSAHIDSLCKWGPATWCRRHRVLPSGRPAEERLTIEMADPTWATEYAHFKTLCAAGGPTELADDAWINDTLARLARDAEARAAA